MKVDEIEKAKLIELYNVESKTLEIYMFKTINAEELKLFLTENKDIKKLSLNRCKLSDGCIEVIADFLCYNNKLESLNLEKTGIGKEAIINLSEAIRHNNFLKYLYLASNEGLYEVESVKELTNAMGNNKSIILVDLYNHEVDSQWLSNNLLFPAPHETNIEISGYKKKISEEAYKNTILLEQTVVTMGDESDVHVQDFDI